MQGKSYLMPAIWGGLAMGILSALPIVGAFNLCCCLWLVTGGMLGAYVLQSNSQDPISVGDGAITGLLAGLIGAVVYGVVSVPLTILLGPVQQRALSRALESVREMPPEVRDALGNIGNQEVAVLGFIMGFVMMLFLGAIFSTAGGALGAVFFRKKAVPPQMPDPSMV